MGGQTKKIKVELVDEQDSPEMEESRKQANKMKSRKSRVKSKTSKESTVEHLKSAMAFLLTAAQINFMELGKTEHDLFQKLVTTKQELSSEAPSRSATDEHIKILAKQLEDVCREFSCLSEKKQTRKRRSESTEDFEDGVPEAKRPKVSADDIPITPIYADHVKIPENAPVVVNLYQTINSITAGDKVLASSEFTEKLVEYSCEPCENENLQSQSAAALVQDLKSESGRVLGETGNEHFTVSGSNDLPENPDDSFRLGGWDIPIIKKHREEDDERSEISDHLEVGASAFVELDNVEASVEDPEPGMTEGEGSTGLVYPNSGEVLTLTEVDGQMCNVEVKNQANSGESSSEPGLQDLIQLELDDPDCKCV